MKYTQEFWEDYKMNHKGTGDAIAQEVRKHSTLGSMWTGRKALNSPTQGTGAEILKHSVTMFFAWIVKQGYFGKIKLSDLVHDEVVIEFPEEMKDTVPKVLEKYMELGASKFCKKLPIPAVAETGQCWIH